MVSTQNQSLFLLLIELKKNVEQTEPPQRHPKWIHLKEEQLSRRVHTNRLVLVRINKNQVNLVRLNNNLKYSGNLSSHPTNKHNHIQLHHLYVWAKLKPQTQTQNCKILKAKIISLRLLNFNNQAKKTKVYTN